MSFTITPVGIDAPYKYTYDGTLLYDGAITYANEPPFGSSDIGIPTYPVGIVSLEAFGTNNNLLHTIDLAGIVSSESFGADEIAQLIHGTSIASLEALGASHVYKYLHPTGLVSKETFGMLDVLYLCALSGVVSEEAFGTAFEVAYGILPVGIVSSQAFGNFLSDHDILDFSIPSAESFGACGVYRPIKPYGFDAGSTGLGNIGFPTATFNQTNLASSIYLYDSDLYNTLYTMEQYCYSQASGYATYSPGFISLSNAIVAWIGTDRKTLMKNFINGLFSYVVMNAMYGTDNSLLSDSIYNVVWSMDGYIQMVKSQATSYYADGTGSQLSTDASNITANGGNDDIVATNLVTSYGNVVSAQVMSQMFATSPTIPNAWSKTTVASLMFTTLGYKNLYSCFNIDLTLPPGL